VNISKLCREFGISRPTGYLFDGEGGINVVDLTYLMDYMFFSGPPLNCEAVSQS
jgi:hypothetical protein